MLDLDAESIYRTLLSRTRELVDGRDLRLVGIHTGGVWIAERLKADLGIAHPVGALDVSFYRDDFDRSGLSATVRPSQIRSRSPAAICCWSTTCSTPAARRARR